MLTEEDEMHTVNTIVSLIEVVCTQDKMTARRVLGLSPSKVRSPQFFYNLTMQQRLDLATAILDEYSNHKLRPAVRDMIFMTLKETWLDLELMEKKGD